ncbi:MAG TPA: class I SAM-dependent methyltransferase, partial [Acidimicrobiia bacterium]|nr:class I SAM-dependent methyltransferase [Acidimicrobiia bacterium]
MSAAACWRALLEAWALPPALLAAVPDSPYDWPAGLWRRGQGVEPGADTPTVRAVAGLLPPGGSLLDVGAGTGRASLALAVRGHPVTAVEPNPEMAAALCAEVATAGVEIRLIEGAWPEVAPRAGRHDVALAAHVVYDVADLAPFLRALHEAARAGAVLEAGERHPWAGLAKYYRALHGLDRPDGPTADLLVAVVHEVLGVVPQVERWVGPARLRFADLQELVELYRRRLLVPIERTAELTDLLAPDIVEKDG